MPVGCLLVSIGDFEDGFFSIGLPRIAVYFKVIQSHPLWTSPMSLRGASASYPPVFARSVSDEAISRDDIGFY